MTHYNIGIIGQGFVGGAVREGFTALSNHTIRTFDIDETKCNSTFEEVVNTSDNTKKTFLHFDSIEDAERHAINYIVNNLI